MFLEEGCWCFVVCQLIEIDYVFVQFGYNDEVLLKEQYMIEVVFVDNFWKFVGEMCEQGVMFVFFMFIVCCQFDDGGVLKDIYCVYVDLMRIVVFDCDVLFIDMDE